MQEWVLRTTTLEKGMLLFTDKFQMAFKTINTYI